MTLVLLVVAFLLGVRYHAPAERALAPIAAKVRGVFARPTPPSPPEGDA